MILVDTSIWIDHLHHGEANLIDLLERNEVSVHPLVIGELALGSLANRSEVLALLGQLPRTQLASDSEVMSLIESASLSSSGLSLVDVHLLAAVRLTPDTMLWTRDRRLRSNAGGLAWEVPE